VLIHKNWSKEKSTLKISVIFDVYIANCSENFILIKKGNSYQQPDEGLLYYKIKYPYF